MLFTAFLYTVYANSKTESESQGDDRSERRAFVAHKLLLLQPQQVVVVRLGSLCSSSHTTKTSLSSLICKHKFACFCRAGALVCVVQAPAPCCWPRLAHKAQWHGFQPICIANIPYAVRWLQRTSDCYEVNRVSVSPANDG